MICRDSDDIPLFHKVLYMKTFYWLRMTLCYSLLSTGLIVSNCSAALVGITVTVQNLAPANGISFAPLRLGFGNGTFDSFNINQTAPASIVSIAEGGSGSDWFPAFAAAEPNSVRGTVGSSPLLPGVTASNSFLVDSAVNQFFTFGSMVVPSNDLFIGNDNPAAFQLLNNAGNLLIPSILQKGSQIWDANSEVADPLNAAFVVGGTNANRTPENGTVAFDFSELAVFNGVATAGGYNYNHSLLSSGSDVYRISFSLSSVPEPSSLLLSSVAIACIVLRRMRSR